MFKKAFLTVALSLPLSVLANDGFSLKINGL
ncbi:Uncharacterised protein [[Pasteurella] aerogenes]|nr:Uncharacterised protein [[Pasteurella] aerogenes]